VKLRSQLAERDAQLTDLRKKLAAFARPANKVGMLLAQDPAPGHSMGDARSARPLVV
jgi:hypothetical protein